MTKTVLAAAALLVTSVTVAQAQTATVAVQIDIPTILVINSTGSFGFGAADEATYDAGYIESTSGPTLSHRANVPYKITIGAQSGAAFGFTPVAGRSDANPSKPFSDLRLLATFGGTAVNEQLGAPASPADWYTRSTRGALQSGVITARMALDWLLDPPGSYSTTVVFTLVAQ
jgi:spore coat protein U-like protein